MPVNRRRFMLLATALVAVNAFFWLAQGGLAIPQALINQFFGNRMVRAEVVLQAADGSTQDWRIDRGVIVSISGTTFTLRERDGTLASVQVDPRARVLPASFGRVPQLHRRLHVVVYHQANALAEIVQVERPAG
ncbi:MAG: hypothetical protein V7644_1230 [Actinomycetota bacterium]|jgi:hypothetical protein